VTFPFVIAGLDPAIHHFEFKKAFLMDARVKPAHDASMTTTAGSLEQNHDSP
jgi:hypothetical protein